MKLNKNDIDNLERVKRLKLLNSISGVKNVNLIATKSKSGISNLSIFSSVTHFGSNPPIIGIVSRPSGEVRRDTINNINQTHYFSINSVEKASLKKAHQTSGKYGSDQSEFKFCGFEEHYIDGFPIPFVKTSRVKIGLKYIDSIKIKQNGTILVLGSIEVLSLPDDYMDKSKDEHIGVIGLNTYYSLNEIGHFDYVRI